MVEELKIRYNPNGDARTLTHFPDYDEVLEACNIHRENMSVVLRAIGEYFLKRAELHDNSVTENFDDYYVATLAAYNKETKFQESKWYKEHFNDESYRTNRTNPKNASLLDLIEGICDHKVTMNERMLNSGNLLDKDTVYQMYLNSINNINNAIEVTI